MMKFLITGGIFIFLVVLGVFLFGSGSSFLSEEQKGSEPTIFVDDIPVRVTIADTPESRTRGLSGQKDLEDDEGMLFVFSEDGQYGFWMKDMRFAIDILWISVEGEVVDIDHEVTPLTYPKVFTPETPVRYVLEVRGGFVESYDIKVGSRVTLERF